MKIGISRLRSCATIVVFCGLATVPRTAAASAEERADAARASLEKARADEKYAFCTNPPPQLKPHQQALCPLGEGLPNCEGFTRACHLEVPKNEPSPFWERLAELLGPLARVLIWLMVVVIVVAALIPIVRALLNRGKTQQSPNEGRASKNVADLVAAEAEAPPTNEEEALRRAEEFARRGELGRALSLYLAASLTALDRRGAIRLAKHRTNGEYVRLCSDANAKGPLREIVREVDRVEFGKIPTDSERVAFVATRATAIVRAAAMTTLALLLFACSGCERAKELTALNDPAGRELPADVLHRSGYEVSNLRGSLATLPMPEEDKPPPLIVIDTSQVILEEEAEAHLVRWVEAGGILALFGAPMGWPAPLKVTTETGELFPKKSTFPGILPKAAKSDDEADKTTKVTLAGVENARVIDPIAFNWAESEALAHFGEPAGMHIYAARKKVGRGAILGVASNDFLTNVGISRPDNAAALVVLLDTLTLADGDKDAFASVARTDEGEVEVRLARREDGVPPPDNPFSALLHAGLGKGAWHALAAALVLFLAYGLRHARPRSAESKPRRAFAEHVEATGAFYERAHAHPHALASFGRFVEARLRERVPRGADPVHYLASRANATEEHVRDVYLRATQARSTDAPLGDELATIEALRTLLVAAEKAS